jgi:hypothetical protein
MSPGFNFLISITFHSLRNVAVIVLVEALTADISQNRPPASVGKAVSELSEPAANAPTAR